MAKVTKKPAQPNKTEEANAETEVGDEEEQIVLNDPYMYLKLIFVLATAIVYLLTVLVLVCLFLFAKTDNSKMTNLNYAAYLNTFKMSET